MTYTTHDYDGSGVNASSIASGSLTVTAGQPVVVIWTANNTYTDTTTISDTAGLTWTLLGKIVPGVGCGWNCGNDIYVWYAIPASTVATTITVSIGSDSQPQMMRVITHQSGAGTPTNFHSGYPGNVVGTVSQAIAPTSSGSSLWMVANDWQGVSPYPYTAGTSCTLEAQVTSSGNWNSGIIRPTTNPRTSGASFTLSFVSSTSSADTSWVAFEVPNY
jgi:hypothetical protein